MPSTTRILSPTSKIDNMNNIIARFITTFCLASACLGAATPSMQPERWARYDLEVPIGESVTSEVVITQDNSTDFALEKRRQVGVCEAIIVTASCIAIKNELKSYVLYMANVIKDLSNQRSCGTFTSQVGNVKFRYHANGKNCDTTAEQATIAGAIENHLKKNGGRLCATECLDLTHGGTWDGFLLIGPSNSFEANRYCGPTLNFGQCTSGGKKDFN